MATTTTKRVAPGAAGSISRRVSAHPLGTSQTSRLSFLLALEGDVAGGVLLLEGDVQTGTDGLRLEGDVAVVGGTATKRIAEAVT